MRLPNFSRKRTSHEKRTGDEGMMTSVMSKAVVVATSLMIHGTSAQSGTTNTSAVPSCVQVVTANFSSCPCDASVYAFSMVGDTSVATNTVGAARKFVCHIYDIQSVKYAATYRFFGICMPSWLGLTAVVLDHDPSHMYDTSSDCLAAPRSLRQERHKT